MVNQLHITKTKQLSYEEFQQAHDLWNQEYPVSLKDRFSILLDGVKNFNHYLIEDETGKLLAWAVYFEKDNEIRFSIIVDGEHKGKGFGKTLVNRLKQDLDEFYGWVIDHNNDLKENGENYISPLAFYEKLGFEILHDSRLDTELLTAVKIRYCKP